MAMERTKKAVEQLKNKGGKKKYNKTCATGRDVSSVAPATTKAMQVVSGNTSLFGRCGRWSVLFWMVLVYFREN
jgi:hypothetical protein